VSWAVRAGGEPSRGSIERLQTDVTKLSDGAEQLGQSVEDLQPRVDELEQRQSEDSSSPRRGAWKPNTSPVGLRIGAGAADDGSYIRTA
jgi:predicted nuclease with TOPRIM domain